LGKGLLGRGALGWGSLGRGPPGWGAFGWGTLGRGLLGRGASGRGVSDRDVLVKRASVAPIQRLVSAHLGRPWTVVEDRDLSDLACHPAAVLSDGAYAVFAKFSDAANGREQFEIELAGLRLLADRAGVLIPAPIGVVPVPGGTVLVLEAVQAVKRGAHQWREIGRTLARIHRVQGGRFGLETNGYYGSLPQDNTPAGDWVTFYGERRLRPGVQLAVESGHLPPEIGRQVEDLIARLPALCGPPVAPTLLHGDAQANNYISTARGPVVIDPAVYYGHPEIDLAALDLYVPVPDDVYAGYQEERPIDPGYWDRRDLWRIWPYLAAVTVEGARWLDDLTASIRPYL
jgi:protein-ribulosamine 3-kinase